MKNKLSSRKLWMAVAGIGVDASDIQTVAGGVISVVSAVSYIFTEGRIDAARAGKAIEAAQDAVDAIKQEVPNEH